MKYGDIGKDSSSVSIIGASKYPNNNFDVLDPNPGVLHPAAIQDVVRTKSSIVRTQSPPTHMSALNQHFEREYEAANNEVKFLSERDNQKEEAARRGAGEVLKSYNSIVDSALSEYQKLSNIMKSKHRSSKVIKNVQSPKELHSIASDLPAFVQKANSDLLQASYVRQRLPPRPSAHEKFDGQHGSDKTLHAGHEHKTRIFRGLPRRRPVVSEGNTVARSALQSFPQGADVQSLIDAAVAKALSSQSEQFAIHANALQTQSLSERSSAAPASADVARWADYLAQAQKDDRSGTPAMHVPVLAALPQAKAYQVTFSSTGNPNQAEYERGSERRQRLTEASPNSMPPAVRSTLQRTTTAFRQRKRRTARLESLTTAPPASELPVPTFDSELEETEQHLKQQVDTIFGPDLADVPEGEGQSTALAARANKVQVGPFFTSPDSILATK